MATPTTASLSLPRAAQRRLAVIVPCYNVEPYLADCLNSLLAQGFADWDAFIIDDGSKDGTGRIADDFAARDARFRVCHTANAGLAAARNAGLEQVFSAGGYSAVAFLDSDDLLRHDAYATAIRYLMEYGADAVVFGWSRLFSDGRVTADPFIRGTGPLSLEEYASAIFSHGEWRGKNGTWGVVWNKMFKADCLRNVRFNEDRALCEDELFSMEANPAQAYFVAERLYLYRQRENSLIKQENIGIRLQRGRLDIISRLRGGRHPLGKQLIRIIAEAMLLTMQAICQSDLHNKAECQGIIRKCASVITSVLDDGEIAGAQGITRRTREFVRYYAR